MAAKTANGDGFLGIETCGKLGYISAKGSILRFSFEDLDFLVFLARLFSLLKNVIIS